MSFDVISLFTKVPLKKTIEIVTDYLYAHTANVMPFNKKFFCKLMYLATQGIFMFNEKLYKHVNSVTIRNPVDFTLAKFFSGHLEKTTLAKLDNHSRMLPKVYLTYIDDVYTAFANINSCSRFLGILNSQHYDIRFTMEKANKTLNFLDVKIELNDVGLNT